MNMKNVLVAGLLVILASYATIRSPKLRTVLHRMHANLTEWTEEDRLADPDGFADYAQRRLQRDLVEIEKSRSELAVSREQLAASIDVYSAKCELASNIADEFRRVYQAALEQEGFPITVRGAAYTQQQAEDQVLVLIEEMRKSSRMADQLTEVLGEVDSQLRSLALRATETEGHLTMLPSQRAILNARHLTDQGREMLADLDALLMGNRSVLGAHPIRNVNELSQTPTASTTEVSRDEALTYLASGVDT